MDIRIKNYIPEDIIQLLGVQKEYKRIYPNYSIRGGEVYTQHPAFENGKNIFCAFNNEGILLAYSPIAVAAVNTDSPDEHPHNIWTDIIYDPKLNELDIIRDLLFDMVLKRALEIKTTLSKRATRLAIIKYSDEEEGIGYFTLKGFGQYETVYTMCRDLSKSIPEIPVPDDICVRKWKFETKEDKLKYVKTDNLSNPNNPITFEKLEWYLNTLWSVGSPIGAFDINGKLVGNVMTYWFNATDAITEEIFVLPQFRIQKKGHCSILS